MNYQTLKQLRSDLIVAFHESNLENVTILDSKGYDALLCFIDEYEELTCKMLQHIKQLETPVTRGKEWENTEVLQIDNDQEDRKWLESYLSLGE